MRKTSQSFSLKNKCCIIFRIYVSSIEVQKNYGNLINGNLISNCPIPCLSSKVHNLASCNIKSYIPKVSVRPLPPLPYVLKNASIFALFVNPEVTLTESYIPEFSFSTFVADLGGSLGLWLGVGAVQIMSSGVIVVNWIQTKKHLCLFPHANKQ